jgi:predicted nucleic acid-binding protein
VAEEESLTRFVDTNVFVRGLVDDDQVRSPLSRRLFERAAAGDIALATSESVVAEVFYVMTSRVLYGVPRLRAAELIRAVLVHSRIHLEHKASILAAIDLYENSNLDFEDCLSVQHVLRLGLDGIYSYDHGFRPALGVRRHEP